MKHSEISTGWTSPFLKLALVFLTAGILGSCSNANTEKAEEKMDTMANKVEQKVDQVKEDMESFSDGDFVSDVIKTNAAEMHLLTLGERKGMNKELKMHAKMMMGDHKKMGEAMKAYATKKNYKIDETTDNTSFDDDAKGADWDKNWADKMVDEHQKVINKFEEAQNKASDQELKDMVTQTLPTLHKHLDMVKDLQGKLNK